MTMSGKKSFGNVPAHIRLDLERRMKYFTLKAVQVIVQSRFGEKQRTKCCPGSSDAFNITIDDNPEVQEYSRKVLCGQVPLLDFPVCIEILVKTSEGDVLVLETWAMALHDHCDTNVSVTSVYCRMTLLLKSAIAITRVTPAYRLSCRQSSDSYVVLYRVYFSAPQYHQLGEEYQEHKIGEVMTPIGCITLSVAYRTKLTITPQRVERESPFMVKSDYFKPDMSPKRARPGSHGFHVDFNLLEEFAPRNDDLTNGVISDGLVNGCNGKRLFPQNHISDNDKMPWFCENNEDVRKNSMNCRPSPNECNKAGAFAPSCKIPDPTSFPGLLLPDTPFLKLLGSNNSNNSSVQQRLPKQDASQNSDKNANLNIVGACDRNGSLNNLDKVDYNCNANEGGCKSGCSDGSDCGDFVMVDLRPPFADSDSNTDIGAFFLECQCAPPLTSFASQPTLEEQVTDITSQLAKFETSMSDFDHFVDSVCQVGDQK